MDLYFQVWNAYTSYSDHLVIDRVYKVSFHTAPFIHNIYPCPTNSYANISKVLDLSSLADHRNTTKHQFLSKSSFLIILIPLISCNRQILYNTTYMGVANTEETN